MRPYRERQVMVKGWRSAKKKKNSVQAWQQAGIPFQNRRHRRRKQRPQQRAAARSLNPLL